MSLYECLYEITDPDQTRELRQVFPFTIGSLTYSLNGLININRLLRNNIISATVDRRLPESIAIYSNNPGRTPSIKASFDSFGSGIRGKERKGLLLHECIHAMQDYLGSNMRIDTAEAAAYIAHCLFLRACLEDDLVRRICGEGAWEATQQILESDNDNRNVTNIDSLLSAIRGRYRNSSTTGRYSGGELRRRDEQQRFQQQQSQQQQSQPNRGCTSSASGFSTRSGLTRLSRILGM